MRGRRGRSESIRKRMAAHWQSYPNVLMTAGLARSADQHGDPVQDALQAELEERAEIERVRRNAGQVRERLADGVARQRPCAGAVHPFAAADSRVRGSFGLWLKVDCQSPHMR